MPNAQVKFSYIHFSENRFVVALALIAMGCVAPSRIVPSALDPANPDAEVQTGSAQLTALTPPGPEQSNSGIVDSTPQAGHDMSAMGMSAPETAKPAGHNMAGMKMSEPPADEPKSGADGMTGMKMSEPRGGKPSSGTHDMSAMRMPEPGTDKPSTPTGHDMAGMKMSEPPGAKQPSGAHDMAGMKMSEPAAAKPATTGHDMSAMKMSEDMGAPGQGEEHLMGVVTRVATGSLDVMLEKGAPTVVFIDKSTTFERGEAKTSLAGIKPGERIVLYATSKEGKWLARVVKLSVSPTPGPARRAPKDVNAAPHGEGVTMPDIKNPPKAQEFTCPMHPEVRSPTPGKCPKCGMTLKEVSVK